MVAEMVLENGSRLVYLNTETVEKLSVGKGSVDVPNNYHVAALVEVGDDIPDFNLALYF